MLSGAACKTEAPCITLTGNKSKRGKAGRRAMKERRNTKQRAMILEAVRRSHAHPSAEQIYLEVRSRSPRISRGTVYRNLNLLSEMGEVRRLDMPGAERYDWRRDDHYHLRCTVCNRVCDAPVAYRHELDQAVTEETGYRIKGHRTVFEGVCPRCARKKQAPAGESEGPAAGAEPDAKTQ